MVAVVHLNHNITEVHIYREWIKFTVTDNWGVYTNNWGVSTNTNTADINHPYSVEHRGETGIIRNTITGKLNLNINIEGFSFIYLT